MSDSRLVYSSSGNNQCSRCGKELRKCKCASQQDSTDNQGSVLIQRQSKGRGGKQVTVVSGLMLRKSDMSSLLKALKSNCGSGGTLKGSNLEIQGDFREQVLKLLTERGFEAKIGGD